MPESGGNDNFWNALITAGVSMYGSAKKKKEDNKQIDWMNSILADKQRYEDEKVARYKSSPAAQMSPMIMEMLVNAYGPKFKKYGINMPLDKMLAAINGGSTGAPGASGGVSGGETQQRSLSQIANGEEPSSQRTLSDMIAAQLGKRNEYTKKTGIQTRTGFDPEIAGYNGKTWENQNAAPGSNAFGTSAYDVGGPRESTRREYGGGDWGTVNGNKVFVGTGAAGDKLAYEKPTINSTQWKDPLIHKGGFDGDGGGWESEKMSPVDIMEGVSVGTDLDKDTVFEKLSRFLDKEGFLPSMVRGLGNAVVPGGPGALDSALEFGINRGWGDGVKGNAGVTKTGNRKRGGKWG